MSRTTRIQREYLGVIAHFTSRPASYTDIVFALGVTTPAACIMCHKLERLGLVNVEAIHGRNGFSRVSLTESGAAELKA